MARTIINNFLRIAFVILLQALVVNRLQLMDGMMLPLIYLFAILMLPFNTPKWLLLAVAFFVGLTVDAFSDTPGFHASASVLMAFAQPFVAKLLAPREGYDFGQRPTVQSMGLIWYVLYAGVLTFVHHLWFFFLEIFRFEDFFQTLSRSLLSSIATLALLILAQFLIFTQKSRSS